jgi:hypothetical protein
LAEFWASTGGWVVPFAVNVAPDLVIVWLPTTVVVLVLPGLVVLASIGSVLVLAVRYVLGLGPVGEWRWAAVRVVALAAPPAASATDRARVPATPFINRRFIRFAWFPCGAP